MEFDKVRRIIAEQMDIDEASIKMESRFTDDLGADSLDIFQIISELEEAYGVEFDNEASEKIRTVGDAVTYIRSIGK